MVGVGGRRRGLEQVDRVSPISVLGGTGSWLGLYFRGWSLFPGQGQEASWRSGFLRGHLFHFLCLRRIGMASVWDAGSVSDTGDVECGPVAGDPEPPVGIPLGFGAVNPTGYGKCSDIWHRFGDSHLDCFVIYEWIGF
jgi:hypothetical protein